MSLQTGYQQTCAIFHHFIKWMGVQQISEHSKQYREKIGQFAVIEKC